MRRVYICGNEYKYIRVVLRFYWYVGGKLGIEESKNFIFFFIEKEVYWGEESECKLSIYNWLRFNSGF